MKQELRYALRRTLPVLCGYVFLGVAFGVLLSQAGYGWPWALLISGIVYAGSMQFALVGLITGGDLIAQLKDRSLGDRLLLPCNMFRSGEEIFLDDVTLSQVEEALQVRADIVKSSGQDLIDAILGRN